jgi:aminoglycoside phosphotransferase (APT) family kinase protein
MAEQPATTPVRAAHQLDLARLERYLAEHVPDAAPIRSIEQFAAGQSNPTYLIEGPARRFVLRKKPPGVLLPRAHLVEREYRILAALAETDVPVPRVHHLCEDVEVVGTAFYVMDHVEGSVDQDPGLPAFSPAERRLAFDSMGTVLAHLHRVDWRALGLADFGKEGGYVARQIRRWSGQYEASRTDEIPAMDRLIAWLPEHLPEDDETTIVHGDFRPGNLIFHPGEPKVAAVLDWELCTLGHPLGDLAHNCLAFSIPRQDTALPGLGGADLDALGIPTEEEYVAAYCAQAGREPISDWGFYQAFAFFRMAAICQGVYARGLKGNASAPNAREYGVRAIALAEIGWEKASR